MAESLSELLIKIGGELQASLKQSVAEAINETRKLSQAEKEASKNKKIERDKELAEEKAFKENIKELAQAEKERNKQKNKAILEEKKRISKEAIEQAKLEAKANKEQTVLQNKAFKEKQKLTTEFNSLYSKSTKTTTDHEMAQFNIRMDKFRKAKFDEVKISEMTEAKKIQLLEKSVQEQNDKLSKIASTAGKFSLGFGIAATGMLALGQNIVKTAANFEQYKVILFSVTKSQTESNKLFEEAKEYAKITPFNIEEIIKATVYIKALGLDVGNLRGLAANLASAFSTDLQTAINAVGRAFKGSSEGYEVLRNQYGITGDEIAKFGGVVQKGNQIVVSSKEAVDQNAKALEKLIKTKYGDSIALQSKTAQTAFSNFEDGVITLKASIGEQLLPEVTNAVLKINDFITGLNNMSNAQKNTVAWGLKTGIVIAGLGFALSTAVGVGANLIQVYNAMSIAHAKKAAEIASLNAFWGENVVVVNAATAAHIKGTAALAGYVAVLASVIALSVVYNETLKEQTKTAELQAQMIQQDDKAIRAYYEYKKTGLIDLMDKEKTVAMIQGAQLQNDQEALKNIRERIRLGAEDRSGQWGYYAGLSKAITQVGVAVEEETVKLEQLNELDKLTLSQKKSLLGQYNDLIAIKIRDGAEEKEVQGIRKKVVDLEKDIQKAYEETKQKHQEMLEKQLEGDIAYINHKKAMGEVSLKDEIAFYDRLLKTHELTNEDRLKITRENQVRERELLQEKNKGDIQWLNNKKELNQVSLKEEIAFYDRYLKTHKISEEERLKITQENNVRRRQLRKEEEDDNKKIVDKAKEVLTKRGDILGRFQDEYNSLTKSETELEIIEFNARLAEYRKIGIDEVKIREMIEKEKLKIVKDYAQRQKEAGEDVNQAEIKRLQSLVGQLEGERGQSPFMSAEEMSARNRLAMLGADFEKSPQASQPITSDVMAQVNRIGESPTNINNTNANTSNDRVYNINIAGISLSGDKAKGLGSMLANLVPLDAVNRAESTIISMA